MRLLEELRRRNVLRVGSAYVVGAWLAAQVAEFFTETFAAPLWVLQSVVVFLSAALVPVLVFTWMFEFTAQGFRRQSELDRAGVVVSRAGRRLDYLVAVLLVVAAGWLTFTWSERIRVANELATSGAAPADSPKAEAVQAPGNSIAVLPFIDLSKVADSGVLADGLAEELLGVLGRNRGLRVTARSSAFQFKDQNRDLREVGRLLGVRYILEGSVRLAAQRVRIGTQLIDASSGTQLWSETYDRTLADLFELQESIASEVAKALQIVLTAVNDTPQQSGTASVEAHMELLRALQVGASRAVADLDQAIAHLRRAIALDPSYAEAHLELANALFIRALQLGEEQSVRATIAPLLDKALQLNPQSGEAQVLQSAILIDDPVESERRIRAGLALAPSYARGFEMLANILSRDRSRIDEAIALLDQAIALDPLAPRNHQTKGIFTWQGKGDYAGAEPHFLRAVELEPRFRMALVHLAMMSMSRGGFAAAVDFGERALAVDQSPMIRSDLVNHYLNIGDVAAARAANVPESIGSTLDILLYQRDTAGAMALIRARLSPVQRQSGIATIAVAALRDADLNGNREENLRLATAATGYSGAVPEELDAFGFNYAVLAAVLRGAGKAEEADRLIEALTQHVTAMEQHAAQWEVEPLSWTRAMLHAQRGRKAEALEALEQAFNPARPYWWMLLDDNPIFDELRQDPRYQALRARLEQHLVAQRAQLAELRRNNAASSRARATAAAKP